MQSWVRRAVALLALAGAAWLVLLARGIRAEAGALMAPLHGAGIVALAGLAAVGLIGLAVLIAVSPAGHRRRRGGDGPEPA
jgi:hypothetical protein